MEGDLIIASGPGDTGTLEAYDPATGDRFWTNSIGLSMNNNYLLTRKELTVVGADDSLVAIEATSGESVWSVDATLSGAPDSMSRIPLSGD